MLKVFRVALVTLAAMSTVVLSGPAQAGMVETPKAVAQDAQAQADFEVLKSALATTGVSPEQADRAIRALPQDLRTAMAAHVLHAGHGGNIVGVAAIAAGVVVVGAIILSEMLWDHGYLGNYNP